MQPLPSAISSDRSALSDMDASDLKHSGDSVIPFETAVMVASEHNTLLGVSIWVADGEMFVSADELLEVDTPVELAFVLPHSEETVRMEGEVSFVKGEEADGPTGMGIAIV